MIIGSAIKFYLISDIEHKNPIIMTGVRHSDVFKQMHDLNIEYDRKTAVQGFFTSEDTFVDRYAAVKEAKRIGQVSEDFKDAMLYSEDVFPE